MNKQDVPGASPVERVVGRHSVRATWHLELTCICPSCKARIDLLDGPDFWDGKGGMQACEHGTPQTTNMDAHCHECGSEFTVTCDY